jgi:hypothetical protein
MGVLSVNAPFGEQFEVQSNNAGKFTGIVTPGLPPVPTAATSTSLATTFANTPIGLGVYVLSRGRIYWSVPTGTGDIAGTGQDWKSDPTTSDPTWLLQTAWFIDAVSGNDDNVGNTALVPLKSGDELTARLGLRWYWSQSVTITILTDLPRLVLDFEFLGPSLVLTMLGALTTQTIATVDVWTPQAGNNSARMTATGIADWTPYVNLRARIVGGTRDNYCAYVAKVNPDGTGVATAAFQQGFAPIADPHYGSVAAPVNGDVIHVETLPTIANLQLNVRSEIPGTTTNQESVHIIGLNVDLFNAELFSQANLPVVASGCQFQSMRVDSSPLPSQIPMKLRGCRIHTNTIGNIGTDGSLLTSPVGQVTLTPLSRWFAGHDLVQGAAVAVQFGAYCALQYGSVGIQEAPGGLGCLIVTGGCVSLLASQLYGKTTAAIPGVYLQGGASLRTGTTVPSITGASGDLRVGIATSIFLSWASIGGQWNDGAFQGTDTLGAGGTKAVAVPYFDPARQTIQLTYRDAAAGATVLSAPVATRTATGFTAVGNPADATSTFDWQTSALGYQQFVGRFF